MPTAQALMTSLVPETEQGQIQGTNNSVGAIVGVASPLALGWAYVATVGTFPGAVFLAAAALLVIAAVIGLRVAARPASGSTSPPIGL